MEINGTKVTPMQILEIAFLNSINGNQLKRGEKPPVCGTTEQEVIREWEASIK